MIRITIDFEAIDEETCQVIDGARADQIASDTADLLRDRLQGEGFLPADLTLGQFGIGIDPDCAAEPMFE